MVSEMLTAGGATLAVFLGLNTLAYLFRHQVFSLRYPIHKLIVLLLLHCLMVLPAAVLGTGPEPVPVKDFIGMAKVLLVGYSGFCFGVKWVHMSLMHDKLSPTESAIVRGQMNQVVFIHALSILAMLTLGGFSAVFFHLGHLAAGVVFAMWVKEDESAWLNDLRDTYLKSYRATMGV